MVNHQLGSKRSSVTQNNSAPVNCTPDQRIILVHHENMPCSFAALKSEIGCQGSGENARSCKCVHKVFADGNGVIVRGKIIKQHVHHVQQGRVLGPCGV